MSTDGVRSSSPAMNAQQVIEDRILAQHRLMAERFVRDTRLLKQAKSNLGR
jgi:hypothetical protein